MPELARAGRTRANVRDVAATVITTLTGDRTHTGRGCAVPPAPEPAAASRRSVNLLAAAVGCQEVACFLCVFIDRPGLAAPLVDVAMIVAALAGVAVLVRGSPGRPGDPASWWSSASVIPLTYAGPR